MQSISTFLLLLILFSLQHCIAQIPENGKPNIAVQKVYPPFSLSAAQLRKANSLNDLNPHYKSSWVKEYLSVEIAGMQDGSIITANSQSDILNQAQLSLLKAIDHDKAISVRVRYIPDNDLSQNDEKEMEFVLSVEPDISAEFPGGDQALSGFLAKEILPRIPEGLFKEIELAVVKFVVNEDGSISHPTVFSSSNDPSFDSFLRNKILDMPRWKPAQYANGIKVRQEYALMIGNMKSCVVNMLNVKLP